MRQPGGVWKARSLVLTVLKPQVLLLELIFDKRQAVTVPVDTFVTRYSHHVVVVHKQLVGRSGNRRDLTETCVIWNSRRGVAAKSSGIWRRVIGRGISDCLTLKMKALWSFETSGAMRNLSLPSRCKRDWAILRSYAERIVVSWRRFGTTYPAHLHVSSSPRRITTTTTTTTITTAYQITLCCNPHAWIYWTFFFT